LVVRETREPKEEDHAVETQAQLIQISHMAGFSNLAAFLPIFSISVGFTDLVVWVIFLSNLYLTGIRSFYNFLNLSSTEWFILTLCPRNDEFYVS
jgi:hypothetical protein